MRTGFELRHEVAELKIGFQFSAFILRQFLFTTLVEQFFQAFLR